MIANLRRGSTVVRVDRMSFLSIDPRIVVVPIAEAKARELGSKIYSLPKDPFKFQDAILVGERRLLRRMQIPNGCRKLRVHPHAA